MRSHHYPFFMTAKRSPVSSMWWSRCGSTFPRRVASENLRFNDVETQVTSTSESVENEMSSSSVFCLFFSITLHSFKFRITCACLCLECATNGGMVGAHMADTSALHAHSHIAHRSITLISFPAVRQRADEVCYNVVRKSATNTFTSANYLTTIHVPDEHDGKFYSIRC